ncbi:hypothetical protein RXV95_08340 [Novosphingobium sp. ZN18A2]|uniref:hypothetical protein n=1 Tax=Novosphingobium sp. ZN18A2 TaxID=3079861 RepID=UPI0030D1CE20
MTTIVGGYRVDSITIDGKDEQDFRYLIEDMLRQGRIDEAIEKLRALLAPYAGAGGILPARFLEVTPADVEFAGWNRLADRVRDHDRPSHPISAIGVALADARDLGGPGPSNGRLAPFIKTFYFSDSAYPFSEATREELLDGYSRDGFEWQGDYQATDVTLSIKGLDDVYGPIIELEDRLFNEVAPNEEEIRAGTIGACYIAAIIHKALRDTVHAKGLPRPLCVIAACDGVYPFFDAPVSGSDEYKPDPQAEEIPADVWPNELDGATGGENAEMVEVLAGEASMLDLVSRKGTKKPVIVLDEEDAREAARFTEMASAQRLDVDSASVQHGVLEGVSAPAMGEAAFPGVPLSRDTLADSGEPPVAFDNPAPVDPASFDPAPFNNAPPLPQPSFADIPPAPDAEPRDTPLTGGDDGLPGDPAPVSAEPQAWPQSDISDPPEVHEAPEAISASDAGEGQQSWQEPEPDEQPAAEPVRHSLRARVEMAQPDYSQTLGEKISAYLYRLRRKLFRR